MYLFTLVVPRRKPFPSFLPNPAPSLSASLSLSLVSSGRKLAARSNLRLVTPSTSDNGGVCPALAARNARREKINNGDPHRGLIRQEIPPPFFHETGISAIIQVVRVFSNGYARTRAKWNLLSSRPLLLYCSRCTFHSFPRNSPRLLLSFPFYLSISRISSSVIVIVKGNSGAMMVEGRKGMVVGRDRDIAWVSARAAFQEVVKDRIGNIEAVNSFPGTVGGAAV